MKFPTLYGKDKNGSYKVWQVWTEDDELYIMHGKENGKMQEKRERVEGKNIGRSNETSPSEQAILEAESRWKKQVDKGYRENKEELECLPLLPMLANDYLKQGHRVKYPCYTSKKLDGARCLAIRHEDGVQLKSRGGKDYSVTHIQEELMKVMEVGDIWDGELYIHGKYLEEITSAVKKRNQDTPSLSFIVFDVVNDKVFDERLGDLNIVKYKLQNSGVEHVRTLGYFATENEDHMKQLHKQFVSEGYEGIMLRNCNGLYESGKRSADLQKYKTFMDEEMQVVGVEEDRNGNAVLRVSDKVAGVSFTVCYGDFDERKRQLQNPANYIGKWLMVKYQNRFKDSKLPQFPTGVMFRDCDSKGNPLT